MRENQQQQGSMLSNTRKVILINNSGYQFTSTPQKQIKYNIEQSVYQNTNTINREAHNTTKQQFIPQYQGFQRKIQNEIPMDKIEIIIKSLFQITDQISKLSSRLNTLQNKLQIIEDKAQMPLSDLRKKVRRRAEQINKNYICPEVSCRKAYGSDVSLNLHLRLKHPNRARQCQAQKERQKVIYKLQKSSKKISNSNFDQEKQL